MDIDSPDRESFLFSKDLFLVHGWVGEHGKDGGKLVGVSSFFLPCGVLCLNSDLQAQRLVSVVGYLFAQYWTLNPEPHAFKASTLTSELHLRCFLYVLEKNRQ